MFKITQSDAFDANFNPSDDIHKMTAKMAQKMGEDLAVGIDLFVRGCIGTVMSPESLALFVDTRAPVPGLDLEMILESYYVKKLKVVWQGKELGHATFTTEITKSDEGFIISHKITDLTI